MPRSEQHACRALSSHVGGDSARCGRLRPRRHTPGPCRPLELSFTMRGRACGPRSSRRRIQPVNNTPSSSRRHARTRARRRDHAATLGRHAPAPSSRRSDPLSVRLEVVQHRVGPRHAGTNTSADEVRVFPRRHWRHADARRMRSATCRPAPRAPTRARARWRARKNRCPRTRRARSRCAVVLPISRVSVLATRPRRGAATCALTPRSAAMRSAIAAQPRGVRRAAAGACLQSTGGVVGNLADRRPVGRSRSSCAAACRTLASQYPSTERIRKGEDMYREKFYLGAAWRRHRRRAGIGNAIARRLADTAEGVDAD